MSVLLHVCMYVCIKVCMYQMHAWCLQRQKKALGSWELEIWTVVHHHVNMGTRLGSSGR